MILPFILPFIRPSILPFIRPSILPFIRPFTLTLILIVFISPVVTLPLQFDGARDFYHELGTDAMKFLFEIIPLNARHFQILGQLVADDTFNIQKAYNRVCSSMSYQRAITLLNLINTRKDLEMLLLGTPCLSQDVVKARKQAPNMWPPTGFPLLVDGFQPAILSTADIKAILEEALKHPESWQSANWALYVNWTKMMDDLRFWRMIPPSYAKVCSESYITEAIFQISEQPNIHDLEELLMKSIRMSGFGETGRKMLKKRNLDENALLDKFSHLQDAWSSKVLGLLKIIYSGRLNAKDLFRAFSSSNLLQSTSWPSDHLDATAITNDIFELFSRALRSVPQGAYNEAARKATESFLDAIQDWSGVRPLVLDDASRWMSDSTFFPTEFCEKYVDRMLINPNALAVLPRELLQCSTQLKAQRYRLKTIIIPLKNQFLEIERGLGAFPYTRLLYKEWEKDRINWPGVLAAHEKNKGHTRGPLALSTCDPKTDRDYDHDAWELAFDSIKFEIIYGIPVTSTPSKCFLQALLHYHLKQSINWSQFDMHISSQEQARYEAALGWANWIITTAFPSLPTASVEILQALLCGEERTSQLTSSMANPTLK